MSPEKKPRSPVERLIVWGLIGVLLLVALIEFRASRNFNTAYQVLSDMNPSNRLTFDDLKAQISGETITEKQTDLVGTAEVELSFFSLFKADKYKLRVQLADFPTDGNKEQIEKLADGGVVVDFYQPAVLAEERNRKIEPTDPSVDTSSGDMAAGMGVGGGDDNGDSRIRPGDGPGAGGRGNRGGRGRRGMSAIAANSEVQTKLNITDEQAKKINELAESNQMDFSGLRDMEPAERVAAFAEYRTKIENGIKEVVDAAQFETLQRMTWAQEGPMALAREAVAAKLGLTEDQVDALAKLREGMDFRNPPIDEMLAVLNEEQKTTWSGLIEGMEPPAPPESNRPPRPSIEE